MKRVVYCLGFGYEIPFKKREIHECPECKSTKIEKIPRTKSSGWSTTEMLHVFFGIISAILLISGFILFFFDVGIPGIVLNFDGQIFYINPLGITFIVIGVIILAVVTKGESCDCS